MQRPEAGEAREAEGIGIEAHRGRADTALGRGATRLLRARVHFRTPAGMGPRPNGQIAAGRGAARPSGRRRDARSTLEGK